MVGDNFVQMNLIMEMAMVVWMMFTKTLSAPSLCKPEEYGLMKHIMNNNIPQQVKAQRNCLYIHLFIHLFVYLFIYLFHMVYCTSV